MFFHVANYNDQPARRVVTLKSGGLVREGPPQNPRNIQV